MTTNFCHLQYNVFLFILRCIIGFGFDFVASNVTASPVVCVHMKFLGWLISPNSNEVWKLWAPLTSQEFNIFVSRSNSSATT